MEVKSRYKDTAIGVLPEDWEVHKLGNIGDVIRGASPRPKGDKRYYGGNIPRLMVEDVSRDGKVVFPKVDFLTEEGALRSRPCKKGTLTIVCSGTVGVPSFLGVDACIHDGFLALVNISENIYDDYLYHQLTSLKETFNSAATHGGVFTNLTTSGVEQVLIPFPSEINEQSAIANTLSDTDEMISSLGKLILKKRAIKQGTLQKLLEPKDGWTLKKLGDIADLKARIGWQGLTTSEYKESGEYYLITGTDFKNGYIEWDSCFYVEHHRYKQDRNIQVKENDILVTKDGTIGKVAFINKLPKPATLNSGIFVIRPMSDQFHAEFFYYLLLSDSFTKFLSQLSAGSTINHLYQKDFVHFQFQVPPTIEEQIHIASILSDIDAEIASLESKLAKYKQIKQGMMQNLLTGRVRLI
ncbi:restriction endonuclease subunit S [Paenibacillus sp. ATY16]|uniref:restriction endonuclease subunit S n=1 Tax=Paenibacillus sp. ATY16 TaxID=1759312 RepID=UPI00200E4000|nr:restriction endonuclease subunit S [Paenibacillus sp. ATY16]MCK9858317.1 restriction endonuclease subunit S [Paenibacillus sp. ATY16]